MQKNTETTFAGTNHVIDNARRCDAHYNKNKKKRESESEGQIIHIVSTLINAFPCSKVYKVPNQEIKKSRSCWVGSCRCYLFLSVMHSHREDRSEAIYQSQFIA